MPHSVLHWVGITLLAGVQTARLTDGVLPADNAGDLRNLVQPGLQPAHLLHSYLSPGPPGTHPNHPQVFQKRLSYKAFMEPCTYCLLHWEIVCLLLVPRPRMLTSFWPEFFFVGTAPMSGWM